MAAVHLLDVHIRIGLLLPIGKQEAQTGTYRFCHWLFGVAGHMDIYARKRDNVRRSDAGRFMYAYLGAASEAFGQGASAVGAVMSTALFIITRNVNRGFLGFGGWNILKLPESWYSGLFNTYLGFTEAGFRSTDYFSLFPWLFLFLTWYFVSRLMQGSKLMGYLEKPGIKALETVGRYSLQIYMLHQPVLYGCFMMLTAACRNMIC